MSMLYAYLPYSNRTGAKSRLTRTLQQPGCFGRYQAGNNFVCASAQNSKQASSLLRRVTRAPTASDHHESRFHMWTSVHTGSFALKGRQRLPEKQDKRAFARKDLR